jgi:hypothetical protein
VIASQRADLDDASPAEAKRVTAMLEPALYRVRANSCPDWVAYASCTLGISVG